MTQTSQRKFVTSLLLTTCLAAAGSASATAYSNMYVFGDSLSDTGNVFALTGGAYPAAPYSNGRFSNGPTYAQDLAGSLGLPSAAGPSLLGGTNYAFGGATAAPGSNISSFATDLGTQVSMFRALPGAADSNALYVLWAGANDLRANPTPSGVGNALTGLSGAVQGLYAEGARNFLVLNLPNLGLTPESVAQGSSFAAAATAGAAGFDAYLTPILASLSALPGSNIRSLDTFALFTNVVNNPGAYGLSNVTTPCISTGTACADYLFWDTIHPTAAGHSIIANAAYQVLAVPEPESYAMLLAGLGLLGLLARRQKRLSVV